MEERVESGLLLSSMESQESVLSKGVTRLGFRDGTQATAWRSDRRPAVASVSWKGKWPGDVEKVPIE